MAELHEAASREIEEEEKKKKRRAAISEASKSAAKIEGQSVDGGQSRATVSQIDEPKSQLGPSASEVAADKGGMGNMPPTSLGHSPSTSRPHIQSQQQNNSAQ